MEDWTEKYRPKTLHDVVGNERAIATLRAWARQWSDNKIPKKRAVILSGKPGVGKTSSALALAFEFGWIPLELNASDARNAVMIKKIATSGALHETFDNQGLFLFSGGGGRKLIILDEADNLYERSEKTYSDKDLSDRGGKRAILETIRITRQPIVLIVNDLYKMMRGGGEGFRELCTVVSFYEVGPYKIVELLKQICREENIVADGRTLQVIADRSKGDVRSAVTDLQSVCIDKKQVDLQLLDVLGYRDRDKIIFDVLREVFRTASIQKSHTLLDGIDIDPETFLLWVAENLPREYRSLDDIVKGYGYVSKADVFFGRVLRRQYYGMWSYACDLLCAGVSSAKSHTYAPVQYAAPLWMKEMKQNKPLREVREELSTKLGKLCLCSKKKSKENVLIHFTQMFCHNIGFACAMKLQLNLSENEIRFLLGNKHQHKLKEILSYCKSVDNDQETLGSTDASEKKPTEEKEKIETQPDLKQPSLLDF